MFWIRPAEQLRIALLASVAATLLAAPARAQEDPRDARIERLEQQVRDLAAQVQALRSERGAAHPAQPPMSIAPSTAATTRNPGAPDTDLGQTATAELGPTAQDQGPGIPTTAATASMTGGKPSIQSADGQFTVSLHSVMQFDAADYMQAAAGPVATDFRRGASSTDTAHARDLASGTDFRRARIGLDGRAFGDFEYSALYEFGGAGEEDAGHIQELWLQYSGLRPLHLRVGAFAPFIGLEDANSTNAMPFLERPGPADIARSLAGGDYREAAQLTANTERWFASAAVTGRLVGVVNASGSGVSQSYDSQVGFVGRAAAIPLKGKDWLIHVGAHGSYVDRPADVGGPDASATTARLAVELRERPELRVDGTRLIDTGAIDAVHAYTAGLELAAQKRNVYLQAEYEHIGIERRNSPLSNPDFSGWYVEGSWILTGEARRYNTGNFAFDGPPVRHPFDPKRGRWGAFELALRYSDIDLNYDQGSPGKAPPADAVRGGDQSIATAGLNWYLNAVVRFMLDFQDVQVRRLSPNATTFQTPAGAQVGQRYQTVSVRSQLAF